MKKCLITLLILVCHSRIFAQTADLILTNGKIFTSDPGRPYVEALAIRGNRILAVGTNKEIEKLSSDKSRKINLEGKTVVPGFNNAHDHLGWGAPVGQFFRVREFSIEGLDKKSVLDSVARLVQSAKPNQWISGDIGLKLLLDPGMREALDSIAPKHPVWLQTMWGHGLVLNSKALQTLGISDTAADPLGGWFARYPGTKRISGALYEYAQFPVWNTDPVSEPQNLIIGLREFAKEEIQAGITTVQNMCSMFDPHSISGVFGEADLPLRVRLIAMPGSTPVGRSMGGWEKIKTHPAHLTYYSGIKYIIDGTPLEQTALMKRPYHGTNNWYGRLDMPVDTIKQILKEALNSNTQLMMHIVGDSSMAIVLSLMKQMAPKEVWKNKRVRIEHNSTPFITSSEMNDIRDLGLLVMHTPKYNLNSPLRSFIEKGITVGISPDGTTNPFLDIMMVTTQQTNSAENITREQAVMAYTRINAYAEYAEKEKGVLAKGMLADLTILSQDIFTVPADRLPVTTCVLTILDGRIVFENIDNTMPGNEH